HAPQAVWNDIATFPAVIVSPTPNANPLRIARAAGVGYFPNGKVYLLGGRHGIDGEDIALRTIYEYAPGANTWTAKAALLDSPQQGSIYTANMAAVVLTNSNGVRIYAVGGNSIDSIPTPVVRVYNPVADSLTTDDAWPASPQHVPGGWAVYNNKLYIFGGFSRTANNFAGGVFSDTWRFDPLAASGSRWTQLPTANLNLGRGYIAGAALDGFIYAVGGDTWNPASAQLVPSTAVERMDPNAANPVWTTVAALPTARGDMGAWAYDTGSFSTIAGHLVVAGGPFPVPDNVSYQYNPTTNNWVAFPNLVHATRNYGTAQLNGILYALGGYDYTNNTPSGANFNQSYDSSTPPGTATPTVTGTLPTATATSTSTATATATTTGTSTATATVTATVNPCANYAIATATATIVPGTVNTGNSCDDCTTTIMLPFPISLYGQTYTTAAVSSNGQLDFGVADIGYTNTCLPDAATTYAIFPYWDDQRTDVGTGVGIFTATVGNIFYIEWRTTLFNGGTPENYEVVLTQGSQSFQIVYGPSITDTAEETVGVQGTGSSNFTQYRCDAVGTAVTPGLRLNFTLACTTPTVTTTGTPATVTRTSTAGTMATVTATQQAIVTATGTATAAPPSGTTTATTTSVANTPSVTSVPSSTSTATRVPSSSTATSVPSSSTATSVPSTSTATSVPSTSTATSVPVNTSTATRTAVATATPCTIQFSDVTDPTAYYYTGVYYLACHGVISGYSDGTYKPFNNTTRGQMSKIVTLAFNIPLVTPPALDSRTFTDITPDNVFYQLIETAAARQIVSGYSCGGVNAQTGAAEPCDSARRPYFRPNNFVTRGQLTKIVVLGAAFPLLNPPTPTFTDVPRTDVFYPFIQTAVCHGIISGYSDGTFRPSNYAFRGQIAKIVYLAVTNPAGTCAP
ncbi:MAG: S-layer homology domain-containing protein, partial [Chloroflexota bacterium]|nr:S-layer homology domain-containing protein [Chloroflexota bacterium]